jgi:hypothetical protein
MVGAASMKRQRESMETALIQFRLNHLLLDRRRLTHHGLPMQGERLPAIRLCLSPTLLIASMFARAGPAHQWQNTSNVDPTDQRRGDPGDSIPRNALIRKQIRASNSSPQEAQEEQDADFFDEHAHTSQDQIMKLLIQTCARNQHAGERKRDISRREESRQVKAAFE